ncbi:MAG: hypothetical protein ABI867_02815 [Kofleriaceae bacterium]
MRDLGENVFDVPTEIGALISATAWRESSGIMNRLIPSALAAFLIAMGAVGLSGRSLSEAGSLRFQISDWVLFGLVMAIGFVVFGPDRHCTCLGHEGLSISRRRFSWWKSRRVLLFVDADDVETRFTRVVSDHISHIYQQTDVWFLWLDKLGREVFRLGGTFDEPAQRGVGKPQPVDQWREPPNVGELTEAIDLSEVPGLDPSNPVVLGFAAVEAFHMFKDKRDRVPYR